MDKVKINEQNRSIATGLLPTLRIWSDLNFPTWRYGGFEPHEGIGPRNVDTVLVQDAKIYFTIEKLCSMKC